jgi:acetylornithine/N-succinyldiaminopimelate aminotransferase
VMLAECFLEHVRTMGAELRGRLTALAARYPAVMTEVRGAGLMLGLKCAIENGIVVEQLLQEGLLAVPAADNVVRLLPPLTIEASHVAEAVAMLERACALLADKAA